MYSIKQSSKALDIIFDTLVKITLTELLLCKQSTDLSSWLSLPLRKIIMHYYQRLCAKHQFCIKIIFSNLTILIEIGL